jgi:hypothetical protein
LANGSFESHAAFHFKAVITCPHRRRTHSWNDMPNGRAKCNISSLSLPPRGTLIVYPLGLPRHSNKTLSQPVHQLSRQCLAWASTAASTRSHLECFIRISRHHFWISRIPALFHGTGEPGLARLLLHVTVLPSLSRFTKTQAFLQLTENPFCMPRARFTLVV